MFDESPFYIETKEKLSSKPHAGDSTGPSRIYKPYCHDLFVDQIMQLDIDYLIWLMPYRSFFTRQIRLKRMVLVDVNKLKKNKPKTINYSSERILSSEQHDINGPLKNPFEH